MRQLWKERIQSAINNAMQHDEVEYGALIVGGRRNTRKKRRHRTVKKDQNNNNKKTNKKEQNKNKKYFNKSQDEEAKNPEKNPLVKHDSLEEVRNAEDTSSPDSQVAKETKSKSSFFPDMPFGLFKKKEAEVEKKVLEEVKVVEKEAENLAEKVAEPAGDAAKTDVVMSEKEVAKETAKEVSKEVEAEDGGTDKLVNGDVKSAVEEKIEDGKTNTMKTEVPPSDKKIESSTLNNKTEDTPLMSNNESKVKDTGPGMLCCTIM